MRAYRREEVEDFFAQCAEWSRAHSNCHWVPVGIVELVRLRKTIEELKAKEIGYD